MITERKIYYVPQMSIKVMTLGQEPDGFWQCELLEDPEDWFGGDNPIFLQGHMLRERSYYAGAVVFGLLFLLVIAAMIFGGN